MTKTWETKKKILRLISKKPQTAMEISRELGLAPSTVSEHIGALEEVGAIRQKENPFVRKWKYYEIRNGFDINRMESGPVINTVPKIAVTFAIVLGLIALLAFGVPGIASAFAGGNQVAFQLTDPPQVPNGTSALTISYSSIQAHVSGNSNSSWISGTGSGTLNLMSLINSSQVIGTGKIPVNSSVDMIRFSIDSAKITINGTTYNVSVPSSQFTMQVTGSGKVNGTSSILIDLSPVVVSIYSSNTTTFVLVPSAKVVMVGSSRVMANIGEKATLDHDMMDRLQSASKNLSITAATLSSAANSTTLSVTVQNKGNAAQVIGQVILFGMPSVETSANAIWVSNQDGRDQMQGNVSPGMMGGDEPGMGGPRMGVGPVGRMLSDHPVLERILTDVKARMMLLRSLNFAVEQNGTLVSPSGASMGGPELYKMTGYTLAAGSSATFTFNGPLLAEGGHVMVTPVAGSSYKIVVMGNGAFTTANISASGS